MNHLCLLYADELIVWIEKKILNGGMILDVETVRDQMREGVLFGD